MGLILGFVFGYACRTLLASVRVEPFYDLVLIDEGQDFPSGFYELCFHLTKGDRDHKQLVWAYPYWDQDVRLRLFDYLR